MPVVKENTVHEANCLTDVLLFCATGKKLDAEGKSLVIRHLKQKHDAQY